MTDDTPGEAAAPPAPTVDTAVLRAIADGIFVIPDHRVPLVPNIGIIVGRDAALVVDTGLGPRNGERVLAAARKLAGDRRLFLTLTHFHPEHGYGAQAFRGEATIVYNRAQREELAAKGPAYLGLFRQISGSGVIAALEGTELVAPDIAYGGGGCEIDLGGGLVVELRTFGRAHTRGDQIIYVPSRRVLFTGDLAEERTFPIFPWFPPDDTDIDGANWTNVLEICSRLEPSIVVPGHGEVGNKAILEDVRGYMVDLARRVAEQHGAGETADSIILNLAPQIKAQHPDWHFPEWIDFAIRYYCAMPG